MTGTGAQPHAVPAVLLQPATAPAAPVILAGGGDVQVSARWKGADGSLRTGEVLAPAAAWQATGPRWTGHRS